MTLLIHWLILSFAVYATAALLPGIQLKSGKSALIVAVVFGLLNFLLGKLLFIIFSVVTLGVAWLLAFITRWLIDALILRWTSQLTDHIRVDGFGSALLGALLMALFGTLGQWIFYSAIAF